MLFRKRLNFAPARSLLVGCQCCPECFQQGMRTQRWAPLILATFPVAVVGFFGTLMLADSLKQAGTLKSTGWLTAIAFGLLVVPFVLFPLLASRMIRRSSATLFDPAVRAKLLRIAGVPHWGVLCRPVFLRKFPRVGVDVELWQLRTVPDGEIQPWNLKRSFSWVRLGVAAAVVAVAGFVIVGELTYQYPHESVVADNESRVAQLQQKLNAALGKLPAAGAVEDVTPPGALEPKPDASNTLFVSVDAVQGKGQPAMPISDTEPWEPEPETDPAKRFPDIRLSEDETDKIFRWRPDVTNPHLSFDPERLKQQYEQLVTARYVVAVRFAKWVPPSGQGIKLTGGAAQVEAFLIDLDSGKILGSFSEEMIQPADFIVLGTDGLQSVTKNFGEYISERVRSRMGQLAETKFEKRNRYRD